MKTMSLTIIAIAALVHVDARGQPPVSDAPTEARFNALYDESLLLGSKIISIDRPGRIIKILGRRVAPASPGRPGSGVGGPANACVPDIDPTTMGPGAKTKQALQRTADALALMREARLGGKKVTFALVDSRNHWCR